MKLRTVISSLSFFWMAISCLGQSKASPPMTLARSIELPGVHGAFDHFAFDATGRRIFLAAEDNGTVAVLNLDRGTRISTLAGFKNPHSILVRGGAPTIFITDSGESASALVNAATLQKARNLKLALGANCISFDAQRNRVYVTAGGDRVGQSSSMLLSVNPDTGEVTKSVTVGALHLQPMALDASTNRLFVNFADQNAIGVFNRDTLQLLSTWRLSRGKRNSPIAFDDEDHVLFIVCDDPGVLLALNSDTGKVNASIEAPADADDMDFDPSTHRLFIPGDGSLNIYDVSDTTKLKLIAQVATPKDAKTGLLLPHERKYLLAVPASGKNIPARVEVFDVAK